MNRRQFTKLVSTLSTTIPSWAITPAAFGQQKANNSDYIICWVHARGGLDQNSWTDPRADTKYNTYRASEIAQIGNIRCAPMGQNIKFFEKMAPYTIAINGLHIDGAQHKSDWAPKSGMREEFGAPSILELYADSFSANKYNIPWYSMIAKDDEARLKKLQPTRIPEYKEFFEQFTQKPSAMSAIIPQRGVSMGAFHSGMFNSNDKPLPAYTNAIGYEAAAEKVRSQGALSFNFPDIDYSDKGNGLLQLLNAENDMALSNANVALQAAALGLTNCIQLHNHTQRFFNEKFSFDSHGNHVNRYNDTALPCLTNFLEFVFDKGREYGISSRLLICLYSEMGRNTLNAGGKDHWPVGGMTFFMDKVGFGNRVVGATDKDNYSLKINPANGTAQPSSGARFPSNKRGDQFRVLFPGMVMDSIRTLLNVQDTSSAQSHPLRDPNGDILPVGSGCDIFNKNVSTGYPTV